MARSRPRILLIGGSYRTLCLLEHLLERGERVVAFLEQEGGSERDFSSEILEHCSRANIATRSGNKFGEEIVRWIEDCIRPELALAIGVTTELPLAIGGNCRFGLIEVSDCLQADSNPGVVLRLRGQEIAVRRISPEDRADPDEVYLRVIDETVDAVNGYLDGLDYGKPAAASSIRFEASVEAAGAASGLAQLVEVPEPGPQTDALEREGAARLGADHSLALRSTEEAFALLLRTLDLSEGDEVICSPLSGTGLLAGIRRSGARAVFADIDPDRLTLDPDRVRAAISPGTRALVIGHPFGQPAPLDLLYGIAREAGIEVIEDGSAALGADFAGHPLGQSPCTCVFRINQGPALPGEEAVLVTLSGPLWARLETLAPGLRLGGAAAARARQRLACLDETISLRTQHASAYSAELARYDAFRIPPTPEAALPVYAAYPLRLTRFARVSADDLHKLLGDSGIETCRIAVPLSERELAGLPATESLRSQAILLPVGPSLTPHQRSRVLDSIFDFAVG